MKKQPLGKLKKQKLVRDKLYVTGIGDLIVSADTSWEPVRDMCNPFPCPHITMTEGKHIVVVRPQDT